MLHSAGSQQPAAHTSKIFTNREKWDNSFILKGTLLLVLCTQLEKQQNCLKERVLLLPRLSRPDASLFYSSKFVTHQQTLTAHICWR